MKEISLKIQKSRKHSPWFPCISENWTKDPMSNLMWVTEQELKFSIKDFSSICDQIPQLPATLVIFIAEVLNEKLFRAVCLSSKCFLKLQKLQGSSCHHLTVIWKICKRQTLISRPCMVNSVLCLCLWSRETTSITSRKIF